MSEVVPYDDGLRPMHGGPFDGEMVAVFRRLTGLGEIEIPAQSKYMRGRGVNVCHRYSLNPSKTKWVYTGPVFTPAPT